MGEDDARVSPINEDVYVDISLIFSSYTELDAIQFVPEWVEKLIMRQTISNRPIKAAWQMACAWMKGLALVVKVGHGDA